MLQKLSVYFATFGLYPLMTPAGLLRHQVWATVDGCSLTHPILIIAFLLHGILFSMNLEFRNELGYLSPVERLLHLKLLSYFPHFFLFHLKLES